MARKEKNWNEKSNKLITEDILEALEIGLIDEVKYWVRENPENLFSKRRMRGPNTSPLYKAAFDGNLQIVKYLWEETNVYYAKMDNKWHPVKWAYFNKADDLRNLQNNFKKNSEMHFKEHFGLPLIGAAEAGHLDVIKYLITNGCAINQWGGVYKKTALHYASEKGFFKIVEFLLNHGADVNYLDKQGKSALFYAAGSGYVKIAKHLIMSNADINIKEYFTQETAFCYAIRHGTFNIIKMFLDLKVDVNVKYTSGETMLFFAVRHLSFEIIQLLINYGADVNTTEVFVCRTVLYDAMRRGDERIIQLLIDSGTDINHLDDDERTPFHYAASRSNIDGVKILLKNRAIVNINGQPINYIDAEIAVGDYLKSLNGGIR